MLLFQDNVVEPAEVKNATAPVEKKDAIRAKAREGKIISTIIIFIFKNILTLTYLYEIDLTYLRYR